METSYTTASDAIGAGLFVFAIAAIFGLRLLYRGLRNDILDSSGHQVAARSWFIAGGILLLLAFIAYLILISFRGYFRS